MFLAGVNVVFEVILIILCVNVSKWIPLITFTAIWIYLVRLAHEIYAMSEFWGFNLKWKPCTWEDQLMTGKEKLQEQIGLVWKNKRYGWTDRWRLLSKTCISSGGNKDKIKKKKIRTLVNISILELPCQACVRGVEAWWTQARSPTHHQEPAAGPSLCPT